MMAAKSARDGVLMFTKPMSATEVPQPPVQASVGAPVFLSTSQREAVNDIRRALAERHVFAAVTGAPGLGKTVVLTAVTAAQSGPPLRVIRIDHPDRISVDQALQTEQMIAKPAGALPGNCHTVIVVDDAERASPALLRCLTRIAGNSRMSQGSSQVILAGRPELWDRLAAEEFTRLRERIAVRPVLGPMTNEDACGLIRHLLNEPRKIFGQMFADDAEQEVLRLADGRPERIGALVRSTLMLGDLQIRPQLSVEMVRTTADMLDGHLWPSGKRRARILRPALAAILAVATAGGLAVAARGGQLDPVLFAARDIADHAVARWTRPTGDGPEILAEAQRRAPADRPNADSTPGPTADAGPSASASMATPPVSLALPPAAQDSSAGLAAESQPQSQPVPPEPAPTAAAQHDASSPHLVTPDLVTPDLVTPEPAISEPASSETHDVPAVAASIPPATEGPLPEAEPSQDTREASDAAPSAEAAAPPSDAPPETQGVTADPSPDAAAKVEAVAAPEVAVANPGTGPNVSAMPYRSLAVPAPNMVAMLLRRGDALLALGDVSTARHFYERTLPAGSALGARGVARTYDPAVLGRGNPTADPSAAAVWYDRAAQLEGRSAGHEASAAPP